MSRKGRSIEKVSITVQNGLINLCCPHCGAVDLIAGPMSGRGFMRRFNSFRRAHDWRCAVEAEARQKREAIDAMTNDFLGIVMRDVRNG